MVLADYHARLAELLPVSNANCKLDETADIRWLPLAEVDTLQYAFRHRERIGLFLAHLAQVSGIRYA